MIERRPPTVLTVLVALTVGWLVVRTYAAMRVGFGDSEALYATYALHPQPAYLDHPALIGLFARFAGDGGAPTPIAAHKLTTVLAALVPWVLAVAARGAGATWRASFIAAIAFACVPEIAVGLFAMTPDLLLSLAWIGALGCASFALRLRVDDARAPFLLAGAGVLAGAACASKASGVLLVVALAATYATKAARPHAKTIWPWVGLGAGLLIVSPIAIYEARTGWPMLRHRLIDTQSGAGLSFRNIGAMVFGQLAYLSPLYVYAAYIVARDLVRRRVRDAAETLLLLAFVLPLAALLVLVLWSNVAEPHWLAPALLALPLHYARTADRPIVGRRIGIATIASGFALSAIVYAWVLIPWGVKLLPTSFDPRIDIANELYGWPRAIDAVAQVLEEERGHGQDVVVVGPHWVICAQIAAALGRDVEVGCDTPIGDDFDQWHPRALWQRTDKIVYVSDNRFMHDDFAKRFPDRARTMALEVTVMRGGRTARVFTISVFEKRAGA